MIVFIPSDLMKLARCFGYRLEIMETTDENDSMHRDDTNLLLACLLSLAVCNSSM